MNRVIPAGMKGMTLSKTQNRFENTQKEAVFF